MTKEEINEFIEDRFRKLNKHFRKAIHNFDAECIRLFRSEIRKLKVFLHLLSMESEDGLSYRITKKMRTIYGYFGVLQNFHLQLKEAIEYVGKSSKPAPVLYEKMLEKELEYWKKLHKDFIDPDYDFLLDKIEITDNLPAGLSKWSIESFVDYTLYEIGEMSAHQDEETMNNVRKFLEDIYYNLPLIKPFLTKQQNAWINEGKISECLSLFGNFQDKCTAIALLQTFTKDALDTQQKQLLKPMENDWLHEKKELIGRLAAKLESMHISAGNLNEHSLHE